MNHNSNQKKEEDLGVKIYKIELLKFQESIPELIQFLSPSESDRANRFHFEKDRNRFIVCRALLKLLLAQHIGLQIEHIILDEDSNKKPYLPSHPFVFFNLSHSADHAIIAVAINPIGVDIEHINKEFNYQDVVSTVFNKAEIDEIANTNDKHHTFYKFWTRKEAIVKAIGKGIDDDLVKIIVTDGQHTVASTFVGDFKKMNVFSFDINDDYIGAIAITEDITDFEKILFSPLPISIS